MNSEILNNVSICRGKCYLATHSRNIHSPPDPIVSLALEKLDILHDLYIHRFARLNMKTIYFALPAFLDHQKHKQYWFGASYAAVNYIQHHFDIPVFIFCL
jgi:hypothetical protein